MKQTILTALMLAGGMHMAIAQTQTEQPAMVKKENACDQNLSVQINQLVRQVLNFSNNTPVNPNPYMLNYSINSHATGWGARAGVGYVYNRSSTDDGITSTEITMNDLSCRIGVDKLFRLSEKWTAGLGLDVVYSTSDDHTSNAVNAGFGGQTTDTKTKIKTLGAGPMGWLRYNLSSKITLGTETSFYYVTGDQKNTVSIVDPFGGTSTFPTTTSHKLNQGNISAPVVLYIGVKF